MAENPKLTVLHEKLRGKTFILDKDQMSAGRRDSMDICIKDASLSGHHCDFIRTESGSYILRDNESTNGTRVNNMPITEQELRNSDIIQLGGVEILYDCSKGGDAEATTGSFGGRTHTISLDDVSSNLSTTREVINYSPFAGRDQKKQKRNNLIMIGVLGVLGLALIGVLAWVGMQLFGDK
ncbi:MAG: FHA domain-containing protein [Lentisphaeria bacterium]|nr:FHA domain-containing protein [Lentisphaeria bacterium]MBQ7394146.1 FHA domain-containing protein [Lentisphaeria bacterium]